MIYVPSNFPAVSHYLQMISPCFIVERISVLSGIVWLLIWYWFAFGYSITSWFWSGIRQRLCFSLISIRDYWADPLTFPTNIYILIDGHDIGFVNELRLLGVTIDNNLTFDTHRSCQTHFTSWKTLATWWWRSSRLKAWLRPTSVASRIPSASSSSATTGSWPTPSIKLSHRRGKKYSSCEYPHCLALKLFSPKTYYCAVIHI